MNWDDVRLFLTLARAGSLSSAGRSLGLDHTTLGRRLSAFEAALGGKLFTRQRSGLVATRHGKEMLALAQAAEPHLLALERRVGTLDRGLSGSVRLATSSVLSGGLLAPHVNEFMRTYPEIALELRVGRGLVSVTRHEADLALRLRPPGARVAEPSAVAITLARVAWAAYRPGSAPPPRRLTYPAGLSAGAQAWLERHGPAPTLSIDDAPTALALVRCGVGCALLPCFLADAEPGLQRFSDVLEEHRLIAVVARETRRVPRVSVTLEWLRTLGQLEQARLRGRV